MDLNVAWSRLEADRGRLLKTQDAVDQEHLNVATAGMSLGATDNELSVRELVTADLQGLRDAFRRLELGTYGRCETCGRAIPDARLAAVPATRFCVEHELLWELRSVDTSLPDGSSSGAVPAERVAEQEAISHFEFVPDEDEDEFDEIRDRGAEEGALHHTGGEPASHLDPGELELAESMRWDQAAAERAETELEARDLRHQAETVAREEADLGD